MPYTVKLAQTDDERERVFALRHHVFIEEKATLQGGKASATQRDGMETDEWDYDCEHLIVVDDDSGEVVGTYRLLDGRQTSQKSFYANRFYDLSPLEPWKEVTLELGRSCVRQDYRSGRVITLLWQGIGRILAEREIRLLIGLPSLFPQNRDELRQLFSYLLAHHGSDSFWVNAREEFVIRDMTYVASVLPDQQLFGQLPPLLKGYMRTGASIAGPPVYDPEFGSTLLFTLMQSDKITERYRKAFVKFHPS